MKTFEKIKLSELPNHNFKGFEIVSCLNSSGDDVKEVWLRDTITGSEVRFTMAHGYSSDFAVVVVKQPKKKKTYNLSAQHPMGFKVTDQNDDKTKLEHLVEVQELKDVVITEVEVEVQDA